MEDRFKFRCYDREFKKFYYWGFGIDKAYFVSPTSFNPSDTMQCTGLKDKNGKLTYEGDIVQDIWWFDNGDCVPETKVEDIYSVEFDKATFWCKPIKTFELEDFMLCDIATNLKIIGNIYENPELLEAANA